MAFVNNGKFRRKTITVTINGVAQDPENITQNFVWNEISYPGLTDTQFAQLLDSDGGDPDKGYTNRLAAFYLFLEDKYSLAPGTLSTFEYGEGELPNGWNYSDCIIGETGSTPPAE